MLSEGQDFLGFQPGWVPEGTVKDFYLFSETSPWASVCSKKVLRCPAVTCVTVGRLLKVTGPRFPHLSSGHNNRTLVPQVPMRIKWRKACNLLDMTPGLLSARVTVITVP